MSGADGSTRPITRISRADAEAGLMRVHFDNREPVIVEGLARDWPCMDRWSPDRLVVRMPDFVCTVSRDGRPALDETEKCTLEAYFEVLGAPGMMTFMHWPNKADEPNPVFLEDIDLPNPCFDRSSMSAVFFYHGHPDGGALPHRHKDAFNVLQRGAKHWVLFDADEITSPAGAQLLDATHAEYGGGRQSTEWFVADLPALRRSGLPVYEGVQRAGDVLYVPVRYAHAVRNTAEVAGMVAIVDRDDEDYTPDARGRYSTSTRTASATSTAAEVPTPPGGTR